MQDDDDTDTDEEPEDSFLSGPAVLRSFPWPPAPSTLPCESTHPSKVRASGSVERSGSVAKKFEFFQQLHQSVNSPLPPSVPRDRPQRIPRITARYSKKAAPRAAQDMPGVPNSPVTPIVCAPFSLFD